MKLVAGLGNPGREYAQTRHNIGFMVVDELARRRSVRLKKLFWRPFQGSVSSIGGESVGLVKPTTYMNRSGHAVWSAMRKWRVEPADVVVVYDDVDLDFGGIRVRAKGSAGSHNGMKSVLEWLQTKQFPRVRVGIGPKPQGEDMIRFVLGAFGEDELLELEKVVEHAADAVESILSTGIGRTMNEFNQPQNG